MIRINLDVCVVSVFHVTIINLEAFLVFSCVYRICQDEGCQEKRDRIHKSFDFDKLTLNKTKYQ